MTRNEMLDFVANYTKEQKLKISFHNSPYPGEFDVVKNIIFLDFDFINNAPVEEVLSVFFHEASHAKCKKLGKFPLYHNFVKKTDRGKLRSQAFRAEKYVDKMGQKEMKKYFPNIKYQAIYFGKTAKAARKIILECFK